MGNCKCEIHFNDKEGEANIDDNKNSQVSVSNMPIEVKSEDILLKPKEQEIKLNKIKNNLENILPEIGTFIPLTEYNNLIPQKIYNYMKSNPLNYKKYIPQNTLTFKSNPVKFNNNNNIYHGNWNENNEMEGYGTYYISERNIIIEGIWINGNIIFGRIFMSNGDIYEGEIKNSLPNGKGKFFYANGEKYQGDFFQGEMTGTGVFIFADKTEYNGSIENGIFNGKGKMKWENGTEYEGNFVNASLGGYGIITNIQREKYMGNFDKNEFNGEGVYCFNNGDEYKGTFEYGVKRGKGIYKRNDKVVFEGIWNDDLPNGNGTLIYQGNKLKGFWRNGILVGGSEIEEGNIENFINIDKDIKPNQISIYPNSLAHLAVSDSSISQFIPGNFV